jgi:hypothetical protein
MRTAPQCIKDLSDDKVLKETEMDMGPDFRPNLAACDRCLPPGDAEKWPERRALLMQLFRRLDEAIGKIDEQSRNSESAAAASEAKKLFVCRGDKVSPDACAFKP